jgi:hypothetical protein
MITRVLYGFVLAVIAGVPGVSYADVKASTPGTIDRVATPPVRIAESAQAASAMARVAVLRRVRVNGPGTPPSIIVAPVSARINDPPTIFTLGSISDAEDMIAQLDLRIDGNFGSYRNGVEIQNLAVDQNGAITANVTAHCEATNASFELRVTDSTTLVSTATLHVDVLPNTPPVLTYNPMIMMAESDAPFAPATGPADNSGLAFTYWFDYGTYTGVAALAGPPGVGVLYFGDPVGTHTLVIAAQDACLLTTLAELQVTVLGPEIFGDGFEDGVGGLAKIKLPAGVTGQVMSMDLQAPLLASETAADAVVDLIEFDVDGHRLLLQAKSHTESRDRFRC